MTNEYLSQETLTKLGVVAEQAGLSLDAYVNQKLLNNPPTEASQSIYERIFEQSQDAMLIIDEQNRYVDANPAALSLLGYTRDELLSMSVFDLIAEDDARHTKVRESWEKLGVSRTIYRLRRKDSAFVYVDISAVANVMDNRHVAIMREASDFVHLMNDLVDSKASMQSVFSETAIPVFSIHIRKNQFYFHDASKAYLASFDRSRDDVIGLNVLDVPVLPIDYLSDLVKYLTQCFEDGSPLSYQTHLRIEEKTQFWEIRLIPLRNQDGQITQITGVCLDLSERQAFEQAQLEALTLNTQLENASLLSKYKAQAIAMIAHEFQTPLSVINTSAYLLKRQLAPQLDEKESRHLVQIDKQVQRLQQLMFRVIDLNQGTLLDEELNLEEVDLYSLASEIADDITMHSPQGANIRLHCKLDELVILTDVELMRQIVTNLISNAVKYSKEQAPIDVSCSLDEKRLILEVRDQGIGIPENDLNNIFGFFQRGKNVGQQQGIGIGLHVVHDATNRLGGKISIDSVEGEGTTVKVAFPADAVQVAC